MARPRNLTWRIVTASVTGPSHVRQALTNQDHWCVEDLGSGRMLLAVADGAGSRTQAAHGSLLAIQATKSAADRWFRSAPPGALEDWEHRLSGFAQSCQEFFDRDVERAAEGLAARTPDASPVGGLRREFATTLLAVVADPPLFGCFGVGDGFLILDRQPGGPHLVVGPPNDREHGGGTVFLTSARRAEFLTRLTICDPYVRGFVLCTDGLIDGVLAQRTAPDGRRFLAAPPEFGSYFEYFANPGVQPDELSRKLQGEDFARTSGDDKTMLMALISQQETATVGAWPHDKARP
jgi:Protein phosphatase 2C